ncbi:MAG: hypothetical protein UR68_C0019G0017 [Candidatus Roizmanbacteria bacterium GW2011_GWA2_35_19]|uniref:Uncharacterized protein n=2 Tax=Candidatus Roizmaniibacteriota TaxID=1752723 RepID=A0A0G0EYJ6_9BACT|nr:MAG: hypothetical protein UR63_C0048G0013 [Candidatus Roizmanbacteria bacterium GW2011_GWC2_35_12]KKP72247.1 MAG: hypothetical protein UR68_C0019G0017 [Candidatus Roizmanbacteria bacterium GW2011_GWA2_35_19]
MEVNWQNIFYIMTSLVMIVFMITCVWLIKLLILSSRLVNNLTAIVHKWSNVTDDIRNLKEDVKLKVSSFLLKVLDKKYKRG